MKQVYTRKSQALIVVDRHIPFHRLVREVAAEHPGATVYSLVNRATAPVYGHWEHVVFNLMMRMATHRSHDDVFDACYTDIEPFREETRKPLTVPVTLEAWETWGEADWRAVSVLSSGDGWDFYGVEWLLHKWESALGLFDDDILCLSIPVYPKDLYNENVHPDVVCREVDRYADLHGEDALRKKFFALWMLCRDLVGKKLLSFFYGCRGKETPPQVFDALYQVYESLPIDHYYRLYLFEKNYSVLDLHRRLTFKPYMLVSQFLSYHGMYVSRDFYMLYRREITAGFTAHRKELHMTEAVPAHWKEPEVMEFMDEQLTTLYSRVGESVHWVGKWHLRTFLGDLPLWSTMLAVWDFTPRRNLYLWEQASFRYSEFQLKIGHEFRLLFTPKVLRSMTAVQKKKFNDVYSTKQKKIK